MQLNYRHKNLDKLHAYARTQECLDAYRQKYQDKVRLWQALKAEGVSDTKCADFAGISQAAFYRCKAALKALEKGYHAALQMPKKAEQTAPG